MNAMADAAAILRLQSQLGKARNWQTRPKIHKSSLSYETAQCALMSSHITAHTHTHLLTHNCGQEGCVHE